MSSLVIGGVVSLSAAILGIRFYKAQYVWGSYEDMLGQGRIDGLSKRLKGKTYIITGANCGIGKETTKELYRHGARIIMACRNKEETEKIIDQFKFLYPQSSGQLVYKHLDLASFGSIKQFANEINQEEKAVQTLINNAAIFGAPINATSDGFEVNMQVNHLAPALLTLLLLPKLQDSTNSDSMASRIIMVTSTLYKSGIIEDELLRQIDSSKVIQLCAERRPGKQVYSSSKLANLLFTRQLVQKSHLLKNVEVCLASPGFTFTRLHRYSSKPRLMLLALFAPLFAMVLKSSKQGAQTIIGCAMADNVRPDVLYHDCKADAKHFQEGIASDDIVSERVYQLTMQALNDHVQN